MIEDVRQILESCVAQEGGFVELRYHRKTSRSFAVEKGRLERATVRHRNGVGVRVLADGTFGFSASGSIEPTEIRRAIERARRAALASAPHRVGGVDALAPAPLARGHFATEDSEDLGLRTVEEKIALVQDLEARARNASHRVCTASSGYSEIVEEKAIVTSDGASCTTRVVRPEVRVSAVAEYGGERQTSMQSVGVTGGFSCLFRQRSPEALADEAAKNAVDLLAAKRPEGGRARVILAPSIVGLLVHEAIGHTVEADFVQAGSVAKGRLGTRVGSELVTLCDSGASTYAAGAGGTLLVDDEGVPTRRTEIIRQGILTSYLHDRESAARFQCAPTGSARAWEYSDVPLIRMRNTYIEPGESALEELIADMDDGYLLDGPRNGQADATGEFMFGVERAWRIRGGKLAELVRGVTISGLAFDVLGTVDGVSREFRWDLGSGYCGKGQPAKVDAGGPYVRCRVLLGGEQ